MQSFPYNANANGVGTLPFTREGGWGYDQFMGTGAPFDAEFNAGGGMNGGAGGGGGGLFARNGNGRFGHSGGVEQV